MLDGLRTVVFAVPDLAAARDWYAALLGQAPYFDQPFYVGFSVGGFELGLSPASPTWSAGGGGDIAYWGVADVPAAIARLGQAGATVVEDATEVGGGVVVAHVRDPFGNTLGVIHNPEFRADLGQPAAAPGDVSPQAITRRVHLDATPAQVFSLWTTAAGMAAWWVQDNAVQLALGGPLTLRFLADQPPGLQGSEGCRFVSWLPDRMLSFTWNAPPTLPTRGQRTLVVIELAAVAGDAAAGDGVAGGTQLTLTHHGWPASGLADPDSGWPQTLAYFEGAWDFVLELLVAHCAST